MCAQNVPLAYHKLVLLLQFLLFELDFLDDFLELVFLHEEVLDLVLFLNDVLLVLLNLFLLVLYFLILLVVLCVLLHQVSLLGVNLLFELGDLVRHSLATVGVLVLLLLHFC